MKSNVVELRFNYELLRSLLCHFHYFPFVFQTIFMNFVAQLKILKTNSTQFNMTQKFSHLKHIGGLLVYFSLLFNSFSINFH